MELQTAGTTATTQKKIYEKPRIEIVNLVADEMVLNPSACQDVSSTDSMLENPCSPTIPICSGS